MSRLRIQGDMSENLTYLENCRVRATSHATLLINLCVNPRRRRHEFELRLAESFIPLEFGRSVSLSQSHAIAMYVAAGRQMSGKML